VKSHFIFTWTLYPGLLVSWSPGLLVSWSPGSLVSWSPGILVSWSPGSLVSWSPVHLDIFTWTFNGLRYARPASPGLCGHIPFFIL